MREKEHEPELKEEHKPELKEEHEKEHEKELRKCGVTVRIEALRNIQLYQHRPVLTAPVLITELVA